MHLPYIFLIFGAILFLGFVANYIFKKFKISSILLLMCIGLLLGPVANTLGLDFIDISNDSILREVIPIVGAIALITILFEAGTKMNFERLVKNLPRASAFTILVFILTVVGVGAMLHYFLGWNWLYGLMFGAAVGGTSSPIVIPIIEKISISNKTKNILALESTLTDVLSVLTVVILTSIALEPNVSFKLADISGLLIANFSVSIFLGLMGSIVWIFILAKVKMSQKYNYALTMAFVFVIYALTEISYGSGAIAVFVFAFILGHEKELSKWVKVEPEYLKEHRFFMLQGEVTFFIRTFFFVYVGLLISPAYFTINPILLSVGVLLVALLARKIAQLITIRNIDAKESKMVTTILPRGLAAAILASYPLTAGLTIPYFEEGVFMTLLLSNVFASIAIYVIESKTSTKKHIEKVQGEQKDGVHVIDVENIEDDTVSVWEKIRHLKIEKKQ